jgi:plasmid stabilization system protein ParE
MARTTRLALPARRWLDRELVYLAGLSPVAARKLSATIKHVRQQLADFPECGAPGRLPGTRRLVVGAYVLTYRRSSQGAEILSVRHGRQRDPDEPIPSPPAEAEES